MIYDVIDHCFVRMKVHLAARVNLIPGSLRDAHGQINHQGIWPPNNQMDGLFWTCVGLFWNHTLCIYIILYIIYYIILYYYIIILYYIVLYWIILDYYIIYIYILLYYILLYCIILYHIISYYICLNHVYGWLHHEFRHISTHKNGGSSNHWGSRYRPMKPRSWISCRCSSKRENGAWRKARMECPARNGWYLNLSSGV